MIKDAFDHELNPGDRILVWTLYGVKKAFVHSFGKDRVYYSFKDPKFNAVWHDGYAAVTRYGGARAEKIVRIDAL